MPDPAGTLADGYDRIAMEKSVDGGTTWKRISKAATHLVIEANRWNYAWIEDADPKWLYRPVLIAADGSEPEIVQPVQKAIDTSYENIITVSEVRRIFLTGVDLSDDSATPFPDEIFAHGIRAAIDWLEHEIDLSIQPQLIDETYDFYRREWENFAFVQLRSRPVIAVDSFKIEYPSTASFIDFDPDWIRIDRHAGTLRVLPGGSSFSQLFIGAGGNFVPLYFGGVDMIPDIIRIRYWAGFDLGIKTPQNALGLPNDVKEMIGKKASFGPLNIAGDLIAGAGIATKSIGIDGLSQSVGTTASATNSGYGSRLIQYEKEIKASLPTLRRYYKGGRMIVA